MAQVDTNRPSSSNRLLQPPARFAADQDLLRLAWGSADSFGRYLQQAGLQQPAAVAGPVAEPRSAADRRPTTSEAREPTDGAPEAPRSPEVRQDQASESPDQATGEANDAGESGSAEQPTPTGQSAETPPRDQDGDDPDSEAEPESDDGEPKTDAKNAPPDAAVVVETAKKDDAIQLDAVGETPSDGEEHDAQTKSGNAKVDSGSTGRDAGTGSKPAGRTEEAGQSTRDDGLQVAPPKNEQEADETADGESPEGRGKPGSSRQAASVRGDARPQTGAAAEPRVEPSDQTVAAPSEPSSGADSSRGRPERAAEDGEAKPRALSTAAQEAPSPVPAAARGGGGGGGGVGRGEEEL
jgi:hypothetical protein